MAADIWPKLYSIHNSQPCIKHLYEINLCSLFFNSVILKISCIASRRTPCKTIIAFSIKLPNSTKIKFLKITNHFYQILFLYNGMLKSRFVKYVGTLPMVVDICVCENGVQQKISS